MAKELDMSAVENCVCFNLRWVTRAVTQFYDAEMRRHGIRPTQRRRLDELSRLCSGRLSLPLTAGGVRFFFSRSSFRRLDPQMAER
jgi:hypothetical protein